MKGADLLHGTDKAVVGKLVRTSDRHNRQLELRGCRKPQFAVTGQGAHKMVRPKSSGISNFADLVESIVGGAS